MKSFSGKASLMATLVAALVGASSAQAAEIKIGVVYPERPSAAMASRRRKGWTLFRPSPQR